MKFKLAFFLLVLFPCNSSNKPRDLIRGNWYFEDKSDTYIKITNSQYIVKNDSPFPEDYK